MRGWPYCLAIAAAAATPTTVSADPIEFVAQEDEFMLFDDPSSAVENGNFFGRDGFLAAYGDIEAGFLAAHADDSQFLVVYTTWRLPQGVGALYQAVANDVRGVGYEHIAPLDAVIPEPYFDDTPNSQVHGFMHMNRWTQYLGADDGLDDRIISLIFGQEFGHAWLAFIHIEHPDLGPETMLGRQAAHWNFYAQSAGSPVEGHSWTDNGDGTFTAVKNDFYTFSDLDLYLMGLLPAEDVAPWFVIDEPFDCIDSALPDGECAPPAAFGFEADTYTVSGTRIDVTVDHVIASEGPREPAFGDAPDTWDVSFLLIKRPDESLNADEVRLMNDIVRRSIDIFNNQTRGLGNIVNRTKSETPGGSTSTTGDSGSDSGITSAGTASGGGTDDAAGEVTGVSDDGSTSGGASEDDEGEGGCGCQTPAGSPAWLLLFALGLVRRRT